MEDLLAANADAENVTASEAVAEPVTEPVPPADPQEQNITKIVSERIKKEQERIVTEARQAAEKEFDSDIADMGMEWNGAPVTTREQYRQARAEQKLQAEAAKQNVPVEVLTRLTQAEQDAQLTKAELSQLKREKAMTQEAETLSTDPKWGAFFKANEKAIRDVAERTNCDLGTAKLIVYDREGPQTVDEKAIGDKAIQDFLDKKRTLNKPTEGSGASPVLVQAAPKTFEAAKQNSLALLKASREQ